MISAAGLLGLPLSDRGETRATALIGRKRPRLQEYLIGQSGFGDRSRARERVPPNSSTVQA
jgi:hypothetical protein